MNKDELLNFLSKLAGLTEGIKQVKQGASTEKPSEIIEYENGKTEEIFKDGSKIITLKDGNKTIKTKYDTDGSKLEETVTEGDETTVTKYSQNVKTTSVKTNSTTGEKETMVYGSDGTTPLAKTVEKDGVTEIYNYRDVDGKLEPVLVKKTESGKETTFDGNEKTIVENKDDVVTTTVYDGETLKAKN